MVVIRLAYMVELCCNNILGGIRCLEKKMENLKFRGKKNI